VAHFLFCFPRFHTNANPWMRILKERGHEVSVHVVFKAATETYSVVDPKVIRQSSLSKLILRYAPGKGVNAPRAFPPVKWYWRQMSELDPDIVIVRDPLRWFSITAAVICVLQRRKLVVYDQAPVCPQRFSRTWVRRIITKWVGIGQFSSRLGKGEKGEGGLGALFIPFGLMKLESVPEIVRLSEKTIRVLMVAKYRSRKGHDRLLDAINIIGGKRPLAVTFCGEEVLAQDIDFRKRLERRIEKLGLSGEVSFVANIDHANMPRLYMSHDLYILPSINEPAAVSPIEAAQFGCAVLVSKDSGTRGYLPPGERFEIDLNDEEDLARKILEITRSRSVLNEAKTACKKHVGRVASDDLILSRFRMLAGK